MNEQYQTELNAGTSETVSMHKPKRKKRKILFTDNLSVMGVYKWSKRRGIFSFICALLAMLGVPIFACFDYLSMLSIDGLSLYPAAAFILALCLISAISFIPRCGFLFLQSFVIIDVSLISTEFFFQTEERFLPVPRIILFCLNIIYLIASVIMMSVGESREKKRGKDPKKNPILETSSQKAIYWVCIILAEIGTLFYFPIIKEIAGLKLGMIPTIIYYLPMLYIVFRLPRWIKRWILRRSHRQTASRSTKVESERGTSI